MNKYLIIGILAILIIGGGWWWYFNQSSGPAVSETTQLPTTQQNANVTNQQPQTQTQVQPSLTLLAPSISSSGDQILKSGAYDVKWNAVGVNTLTVALVKDDGSIIQSTSVAASSGSYTLQIPEVPGSKGAQPKYHFLLSADNGLSAKSNSFVIGCVACAPPGN